MDMRAFSIIGECAEKSELVNRLVAECVSRGLRVSTMKRVSDAVDLEKPGSGTWRQRRSGAEEVVIANARRIALLRELPPETAEPDVVALLARMAQVDLVLLDGFRRSAMPKMEVLSAGQLAAIHAQHDRNVMALASDRPSHGALPHLDLAEIGQLLDFVWEHAVPVESPYADQGS
jgi:molybdopterin-guanine dinucleotide biosynthesis adapter protein